MYMIESFSSKSKIYEFEALSIEVSSRSVFIINGKSFKTFANKNNKKQF